MDELNPNGLIYYFKDKTARKKFQNFNNAIQFSIKIKSGDMKIKMQNVFKVRTQSFSKKFRKKYFFDILTLFEKIFQKIFLYSHFYK